MNRFCFRTFLPLGACLLALSFPGPAGAADDEATVKAWLDVCRHYSGQWTVTPTGEGAAAYERLPQPIFRHAQPARGNDVGAVWLWVDRENRPVAIGDTFTWSENKAERHVTQEFHSLVGVALDARLDGQRLWTPPAPGVEWRVIPDSPAAGETKAARSREARAIVRRFSGHTVDGQKGRWELRIAPQPVHQYDLEGPQERQAGALFALCQGTDPEVWIALECRRTAEGLRWHYAPAMFTDHEVHVALDDKEVWQRDSFDHGHHRSDEPHWIETISDDARLPAAPAAP